MRADRLSVIIPAYNAAATIGQAIRSALDQVPAPDEVIVGDDGSTDDTAEVAEAAGATVVRLQHGNGSMARNRAAEASTGDLLFFLDADDWWQEGKIEAHLQTWACAGPSFVFDVATKIASNGRPSGLLGRVAEGAVGWESFLDWRTWASGSSFSLPRTRYAELGGFDEDLISQQDVDFWIRAAHRYGPASRIAKSFTNYRISPGGVSKRPREVQENLRRLLDNWPFASSSQKREFFIQMTLTAAGFSPVPASLKYFALAGWPVWRGKFYRALARSLVRSVRA